MVTAADQAGRDRRGEFVGKAKLEAVDRRHRRPRQVPLARGAARADRHRPAAARPVGRPVRPAHPRPPACGPTTRRWCCSPRARRAGPRASCSATRNILANRAQISARVDFNQRDKVFNALPVFHSFGLTGGHAAAGAGRRAASTCTPRRCTTGSCRSWSTAATPRSSSAPTASSRATGGWRDPYDFCSLRYVFAGAEAIQDETQQAVVRQVRHPHPRRLRRHRDRAR